MTPEQTIVDGNVHPTIEVADVAFTLIKDEFEFNADGNLSLYNKTSFKDGLKNWLTKQI